MYFFLLIFFSFNSNNHIIYLFSNLLPHFCSLIQTNPTELIYRDKESTIYCICIHLAYNDEDDYEHLDQFQYVEFEYVDSLILVRKQSSNRTICLL